MSAPRRLSGPGRGWGAAILLLSASGGSAPAQHQHAMAPDTALTPRTGPVRGPLGGHSSVPTAVFDAKGTLLVAFVEGEHVYVTRSEDGGRTFAAAVSVNPQPEKVDANGEARPKIAVGRRREVYVTYTHRLAKAYTGDIRFSRSTDGGRTFSPPITVNDDGGVTGHRFDALGVGPRGDVHVAWIDKRDLDAAQASGRKYSGAALYYAVSRDGGRTFAKNVKLKDEACECCRIAFDFDRGTPVLLWRDILPGGIRDHALMRLGPDGPTPPRRASMDDWKIEACPHHGPALAVDAAGVYHAAWFTAGTRAQGLLYAHSSDGASTFSTPFRFGSPETSSHPALLAAGASLYLAWKESLPEGGYAVRLLTSSDGGTRWSAARDVARTQGSSDHPLLIARGRTGYLSWFTEREGYRLLPL